MEPTNASSDGGRWAQSAAPSSHTSGLRRLPRPDGRSFRVLATLVVVTVVIATVLTSPAGASSTTTTTTQTATQLVFSTQPASATGGTAFGTQPVVTFEDASNAVVSGDTDTVTLSIESGTGASGAVLTCPPVAAVAGVATFTGCAIDKASPGSNPYQLEAVSSSLSVVSSNLAVTVGSPAQVSFVDQPASILAGQDFATAPELAVTDAGGNIVTSSTDTIGLAVLPGPGFGPLVCSGSERAAPAGYAPGYKLTAVNGVATFTGCTIDQASSSSYVLATEATDGTTDGTFANESSPFAVSAGAATQLVFTTEPTGSRGASPFATQPVVTVEDATGNVVTSATPTISLSITPDTGATGAALTCAPATAVAGVATFSGCSINDEGSSYTLTASGGGLTGSSAPFSVTVSTAANLSFGGAPGNATGGSPLPVQPVVTITDGGGNPVSGSVTLALIGGTPGATLSCPTNPEPAGTGTATFSGCSVNLAGTGYQLVATDTDSTAVTTTSAAFNVTVGAAAQLAFSTPPSGATGGSPFATQPTVSVEDLGGNPVPSVGQTISLALTPGTGPTGAHLACSGEPGNSTTTSTGSATFAGCAVDKVGSAYTLTAVAGGLVTTSPVFTVSAGNAAELKFTTAPAAATVSSPFGSQPQVVVADAGGNPVGPYATTVTLSISSGTVTCTTNPVSTTSGIATFSGCQVPSVGTYTLTATATGLTSATSGPFTVVAGAALGTAPVALPTAQTFGGALYSRNTTDTTDDVNSATGALELSLTDLKVAGIGEPFSLVRSYNSDDATGGSFGTGWTSIFDAGVKIATGGKTATVRGEDGQQLVFASNGSGGWIAPPAARETLTCSGTTCTVVRFDGVSWQSIGGHIQNELSPGGEGLHFTYTNNLLSAVTVQRSTTPLTITVTENATGQVTKVATPTRSVSYRYTNGNLTGFTDADGNAWTYNYGASGLTQEIDPLGHLRLAVSYAGGRVATAQAEGSDKLFDDAYTWNAATQTSTRLAEVTTATGPATGAYTDQYKGNVLVSQESPSGGTTAYSYDNQLDLTELQDPLGHIQQLTYDAAGDLITQSSPWTTTANSVTRMGYDSLHRMTSSTDPNGNTTTYTYTGTNLTKVTPPGAAGGATTYLYNSLGERTEADGPTGIQTYTYDAAGNLTGSKLLSLTRAPLNGLGSTSTHDEAGDVLTSTDARGNLASGINSTYTTSGTFDADGNQLTTTTPGPQTTTTTYTAAGDVASVTAANGSKTTFGWNQSNLTSTATTSGATTATAYDPSGDQLSVTDAGGRTTTSTYDASGRQLTSTSTANITTTYTYNVEGDVVATSDTAGNTGSFTYSPANQKLSSTLDGVTTSVTYDGAGNVASQTDGAGNVITYTYNSHEKLASVATSAGTTTYAYDLSDNLSAITDGDGHTVAYTHNGAGQLTAMIVNGHTTSYTYDVDGNLTGITDPDGRSTKYTVNAQDLRTGINYSQAGQTTINITEAYNAAGQRTQMTDPTTGTHTYTYDPSGNLTSAANGANNTYSYDYSTPGVMTETYPDGTKVSYGFDDAHNVMSVTAPGVSVSYLRNTDRQVTGIAYSNGLLESQSYNQAGQVVNQTLSCGSTVSAESGTSYNGDGAPVDQETTVGSTTSLTGYGYDTSGRVTAQATTSSPAATATSPGACTPGTQSTPGSPQQNDGSGGTSDTTAPTTASSPATTPLNVPSAGTSANPITYDAVGNRTTDNGTTTTYNAANEVATQTGAQPATYTYDNNGDVTGRTIGGVTTTYGYNAADQLVKVVTGATTVTYTYDGDGNRVSQTVANGSGTTTDDYSWDPSGNVPLLTLERTPSNGLIRRYVYGVGPVAMQTPAGTYYLTTDPQGDVTGLSDSTGAILETYAYDAYGNVTTTQVGATVAPAEPLLFQSQYLDPTTGLYDMRARNYDPTTGRFTQRDPVMASAGQPQLSPYSFANDEPTSSGDPTGQASSTFTSAFSGHSTESANIVTDTGYGLKAANLVIVKPIVALVKYASKAESAAVAVGDSVADAGAGIEADAGEAGGGAADAGDAGADFGDVAGKALGVIGIGLALYVTVEDCEHGTVSQCVGDTVGTAVSLACLVLTEGVGAVACGLAGAALGYVISHYGPQIAAGLEVAGKAIAAISVEAGEAIKNAVNEAGAAINGFALEAGTVLNSAFDTAGAAVNSFALEAGAALNNAFDTAAGAISDGFNKAVSAISSGFDRAVGTLEQAGYTAEQMALSLKNDFNEGLNAVVNELATLAYDVDGVASALEGVYNETAQAAGVLLNQFEYAGNQIADGLKTAYAETAAAVGAILQSLNEDADQIASALDSAYQATAAEVASILNTLNYGADLIAGALDSAYQATAAEVASILNTLGDTADEIAGALDSAYQETAAEVASILNTLGATADEIAGALDSAYQETAAEVASILNTLGAAASAIASALDSVYAETDAEVASILNTLGFAADTIASALESAYNDAASAVASVLNDIGYTASQIEGVLSDVFSETTSAIESELSSLGFNSATIDAIGGAFTSFGDAVAGGLTSAGNAIVSFFKGW